ncbi:lysozyme inhibitor LprI family protein [Kosakonia sp. BYX6]|uniref:Lysozyme inhibitor LprI family protein n=1 Tax=Kosakonia calanthes TaxID=3139408 RepID=A0ABZ3B1Z6_9ENTR
MKISQIVFIALSLATFATQAASFQFGKEVKNCLTLPSFGDNVKTQSQCKEEAKAASEKSLNNTITRLHKRIKDDYNTPYHLNDIDGVKIKDVFWEKFINSQKSWSSSREEICSAMASLVGEWAESQDDIQTQCILDQNKGRERYLKEIYLK